MRESKAFHRLGVYVAANYGLEVKQKFESQLVKLVMPDATEAEIEEATQRWFGFLQVLNRIATEQEKAPHDSRDSRQNDRFKANNSTA